MERYGQDSIGKVCKLHIEDIEDYSIEELIDRGKRFMIINNSEEDEEDMQDGDK